MTTGVPSTTDHGRIVSYYEQCWIDYRWLWLARSNLALHFGFWDENTRRHADSLVNMNRLVAARAELRSGERALDAGCGVGGTALWLAERCGVRVVGVNVTRDQLSRAARFAASRDLDGAVALAAQDHSQLAFAGESFDVVYAIESMCHAADKQRFLAEAFRVLKPGGRLVVLDGFLPANSPSQEDLAFLSSWLSCWMIPHLASAEGIVRAARTIGFEEAAVEDITANVRPSLRRLFRIALALYPGAALLRALRLRSAVQHGNVLAALRQWRALERGLWFYGILLARK